MKKIILLLLFVPFVGFCQNCKFEKNEIDAFYKTKIIRTQLRPITFGSLGGGGVDLQFLFNTNPFIIIKVNFSQLKLMETKPENNILFLLTDNSVITYNIGEIIKGKMSGDGGLMSSTSFEFEFKTTIEELNKVKNIGIKKIRFEYNDGSREFEVSKKKFIDKTNNTINCFLNEIMKD
jgi:hypothetical protein